MIEKTLSGFPILDGTFGGVYSNRSFLVCGAKNSGKTIMGLRFIQQGIGQNERCLYLSTMLANDLSICAGSIGFDLSAYINSSTLTLLEYETFIHGNGIPGSDMLPPEGFDQLRDIIHANSIERVVLDTVLPWVAVKKPNRMAEQVFSFVRSFDRLGVTTMLTLPKPVSSMAFRLKKSLEDVVPVSILLVPEGSDTPATAQVVKYLGEKKLMGKIAYEVSTGEKLSLEQSDQPISVEHKQEAGKPSHRQTVESDASQSKPAFRSSFSEMPQEHNSLKTSPPESPGQKDVQETNQAPEPPEKDPNSSKVTGEKHEDRKSETSNQETTESAQKKEAARLSTIWNPQNISEESSSDPSS